MPQLGDGYTRIANEILEKVSQTKLNGTQLRILLVVWRCTYGWHKKEHELSESFIANATDIHRQQIKRELKKLINDGILIEVSPPSFNTGRVIAFNKNYVISTQVAKKIPHSELDTPTGSELDTPTGSELDTQKRKLKKYKDIYDYYLTLDLINHKNYTKDMTEAMRRAEKDLKISTDDMKSMLKRHEERVKATANTDYPIKKRGLADFFGQKKYNSKSLICVDYLDENYQDFTKPEQVKQNGKDIQWLS